MEHVVVLRLGELIYGRVALGEALEVGNDRAYLCLLKHDLGEPDSVRCPILLPGQMLSAFAIKPLKQALTEGFSLDNRFYLLLISWHEPSLDLGYNKGL